jgi:hypothetical protein
MTLTMTSAAERLVIGKTLAEDVALEPRPAMPRIACADPLGAPEFAPLKAALLH